MISEREFFLITDIGATNSRVCLKSVVRSTKTFVQLVKEETFQSNKEKSLEDVIFKFLKEFKGMPEYPKIACLALAGPLNGTSVTITNVPHWPPFDYKVASINLNIPEIKILNDFEANGYGILNMDLDKALQINKGVPAQADAPKAFIGTGTGLGEGIATKGPNDKNYSVFPSEGGHADFSPRNDLEFGLLMFVKDKFKIDRVSVERCCCGLAIGFIYEYLLKVALKDKISTLFEENGKDLNKISNEMIFEAALNRKDEVCVETLKLFTSIYGGEAGNLALKILPFGGLFLMSGITMAIKKYIVEDPTFLENFLSKGRMRKLLDKVPIFFADEDAGLKGSENYVLNNILI